ncbi:beta/gamma crystallin domain-containing protein 1 isoform X2 [Pseudophryne corroboree]|uniref:beta/gamma crystallin domain-containing protein 1 isoform X2 n=1 Tax=Pseudophryne corroboree TaxID=495146 RepID=UPI00308182A7
MNAQYCMCVLGRENNAGYRHTTVTNQTWRRIPVALRPPLYLRQPLRRWQKAGSASRSPSAESPKKDTTKKPVLGKFGNLFNSTKKKQSKGIGELATSPTNEKTLTYKSSEKETARERKRVQISVTSSSKVHTRAFGTISVQSVSDQPPQHISKESALPVGQSEKETTNSNIDIGLTNEDKERDPSVEEVVETSAAVAESPAVLPEAFSDTSQKPAPSTTPKVDKQSSTEKSVRPLTQSPGKRISTESSVRRLQVISQEINISKDESPKFSTRKTTKFSSRITDSKLKIPDRSVHKSDSTEKLNTAKLTVQVPSHNHTVDQEAVAAELNSSCDAEDPSNGSNKSASISDASPALSPTESDIFAGSEQEKPGGNGSSDNTSIAKVLSFDIYLSKTVGTSSPTSTRACSNGEAMEKSPINRKNSKKRRSLKSQSSQNDEKKTENTPLHDNVFEYNFEGVREYSTSPDSNIKPVPLSPEYNGTASANQEIKAGANHKLLPKGDSDKDKQEHPASSPMRKKSQSAWVPSSPTARKAQTRDPLFRNQAAAASAKATEFNQAVPVSTTKDAYVEKASVSDSLTGRGWENLCDTSGDNSPTAAGILSQDRRTKQENIQGVQRQHSRSRIDSDSPTQSPDLLASKPQTPLNGSSKSTVTSKLNIPPKPKNVELPIRPKVVDNIDEATTEAHFPKGNIASKVSLFENKRTSHRQIDFYATKNISQPKKFVERAKLNFGKQVKGAGLKDSSSSVKSTSDIHTANGKKSENGHCEIKADTSQTEIANHKVDHKPREDRTVTLTNQMQMEDNRNGLEAEGEPVTPQSESILPSVLDKKHNDHPVELSKCDVPLSENNTTLSDDLQLTSNTEDTLLHSSQDSADNLAGDITPLEGGVGFRLDSTYTDMGNAHNSVKKEPIVSTDVPNDCLTQDSNPSHLDAVDSVLKSSVPSTTDQKQINDCKTVLDKDRKAQAQPTDGKDITKSPKTRTNKKKTQIEEPINNDAKKELQKEDILILHTNDTKSEDTCYLPGIENLNGDVQAQSEPLTETEEVQNPLTETEEVQNCVEGLREHDLLQKDMINESKSLPTAESLTLDAIIQPSREEPMAGEVNNVSPISTTCSVETNNGPAIQTSNEPEAENSCVKSVSPQSDVSLHQALANSLDGGEPLREGCSSQQNGFSVESNKNESEQITLCSDISAKESSHVVLQNITKDIVSCPEAGKENLAQYTSYENEVKLASDIEQEDNSQKVSDLPVTENKHLSECSVDVVAEEISEDLINTENQHKNVLSKVDKKEVDFNIDVGNNNSSDVNVDNLDLVVSSIRENGCIGDPGSNTSTNGTLHPTEDLAENLTNVQHSPDGSLNASIASEESSLDSSSDMEKFAEAIRKLDSSITVPQKRKKPRTPKSPGPYCGLPPIREDYLEKILDTESFSFGLGKKDRAKELAPMALFKLQSKETAEKQRPKRASAEQSMILKSLRSHKEPLPSPQETCGKEKADVVDLAVKRSRIESIYSNFKSPFAARTEENVFSPTVTTVSTITTSFDTPRMEFTPLGKNCDLLTTDSAETVHTLVQEGKGDLTLQSSNYSQSDSAQQVLSTPVLSMDSHLESSNQEHADLPVTLPSFNGHTEVNHSTPDGSRSVLPFESTPTLDKAAKDVSEVFYFKGQDQSSFMPSLSSEVFSMTGAEKINPRPGKVVIISEPEFGGAVFEVFSDVMDCSSWELSPTICIKTIRGCWILYEQPNFEGRSIPLEEGDLEVSNPWADGSEEENSLSPVVIGSLRHVVKDYRICQIDLFTDPEGLGIMTSYFDDTEELQVYGRLQRTCSIKVHCGIWLVYEESGFQGVPYILEPREYPDLSFWNTQEAYIGSMRPLKMGSRKVEIPYEPKIIIFEKPMFEGRQVELEKELLTFANLETLEGNGEEPELHFTTVGSMRVLSGLWVGYEKPEFEGHQYFLEEGDYEEWNQWGGYNGLLQSLRPILSDFSTPHMTMYSEKDLDEKAPNINVLGIISNMEETGFGVKTQSINVVSGVWVAYESPDFTGKQYILEKGLYYDFSDWGGKNCKISSVQPIILESIETPGGNYKVELFSEPDFQGQSQVFAADINHLEEEFKVMSCKVTSGRWAAYDKVDFSGNLWVLEEGIYPNLCAMGCPNDIVLKSLKIINYEFSEPNLVLYGKENHRGRRVILGSETTDLQAMGYSTDIQSLEVLGGIWVFYEYTNYRGQQLLISPSKIAQWQQFSGWNKVGSLRPLRQKRLYFKLRNKGNGMLMSTNGNLDDINLLRIQVMEDTGAEDQIWVYQKGILRCRIAEDCSLASAGTLITAGCKLSLSLEQSGTSMRWSVKPDGRIYSCSKPNLVLDIKGGSQYDQQHVVLNPVTEGKLTQLWEMCVL